MSNQLWSRGLPILTVEMGDLWFFGGLFGFGVSGGGPDVEICGVLELDCRGGAAMGLPFKSG